MNYIAHKKLRPSRPFGFNSEAVARTPIAHARADRPKLEQDYPLVRHRDKELLNVSSRGRHELGTSPAYDHDRHPGSGTFGYGQRKRTARMHTKVRPSVAKTYAAISGTATTRKTVNAMAIRNGGEVALCGLRPAKCRGGRVTGVGCAVDHVLIAEVISHCTAPTAEQPKARFEGLSTIQVGGDRSVETLIRRLSSLERHNASIVRHSTTAMMIVYVKVKTGRAAADPGRHGGSRPGVGFCLNIEIELETVLTEPRMHDIHLTRRLETPLQLSPYRRICNMPSACPMRVRVTDFCIVA
ncbi:hypothetical protein EVAR_102698_1 [Eumeta japonica]|uniref:Uncharacterized protein n=1 Tax=Eumeta variegata TaxID=151549 RepID=A0A4C1TK85_EUMVA|nr:hypothetical protein EVAR_102698_1 [Eumeta japonica]